MGAPLDFKDLHKIKAPQASFSPEKSLTNEVKND
jgi:hypothetical protein